VGEARIRGFAAPAFAGCAFLKASESTLRGGPEDVKRILSAGRLCERWVGGGDDTNSKAARTPRREWRAARRTGYPESGNLLPGSSSRGDRLTDALTV